MTVEIRAQVGPQYKFLTSPADIAIYGGGAGGGKSWALLMKPLNHIRFPGFGAVLFRRTYPQIKNEGGLWDDSGKLYPYVGGVPRESDVSWIFPKTGNQIKFAHLEHEKSKYNYQGSQICYIGFDELTHFSESQFFYMLSRNRSTCGIKPYIRATCNPDAESWVSDLIAWWIDKDGYPIPERSGVLRYFARHGDGIYWGNSRADLWEQLDGRLAPEDFDPKTFTFIPARLEDNPALMRKDPSYRSNLLALSFVDRMRLLAGNWKIKPSAGNMFRAEWLPIIEPEALPVDLEKMKLVRWWDTAATEPSEENKDPDWTAGVLWAEYNYHFYVLDLQHFRKSPGQTEATLEAVANMDGRAVEIGQEQEPGSAGKREIHRFRRTIFRGFSYRGQLSSGDKVTRAKPLSSAAENGLISLVRGEWNQEFINELVNFPDKKYHDDIVDAASAGFYHLSKKLPTGTLDASKLVRYQHKGGRRDPTAETPNPEDRLQTKKQIDVKKLYSRG